MREDGARERDVQLTLVDDPLGPLVGIGLHRSEREEGDEGDDGREHHQVEANLWPSLDEEHAADNPHDLEGAGGEVVEDTLEVGESEADLRESAGDQEVSSRGACGLEWEGHT